MRRALELPPARNRVSPPPCRRTREPRQRPRRSREDRSLPSGPWCGSRRSGHRPQPRPCRSRHRLYCPGTSLDTCRRSPPTRRSHCLRVRPSLPGAPIPAAARRSSTPRTGWEHPRAGSARFRGHRGRCVSSPGSAPRARPPAACLASGFRCRRSPSGPQTRRTTRGHAPASARRSARPPHPAHPRAR